MCLTGVPLLPLKNLTTCFCFLLKMVAGGKLLGLKGYRIKNLIPLRVSKSYFFCLPVPRVQSIGQNRASNEQGPRYRTGYSREVSIHHKDIRAKISAVQSEIKTTSTALWGRKTCILVPVVCPYVVELCYFRR